MVVGSASIHAEETTAFVGMRRRVLATQFYQTHRITTAAKPNASKLATEFVFTSQNKGIPVGVNDGARGFNIFIG